MILRTYQSECVEACFESWKKFRKILAVLPTGSGKTIVFSKIAEREKGRVLILAHRDELIQQARAKLESATGIVADVEQAEHKAELSSRVVVGSIQTMAARGGRWPANHFSTIIIDEAHRTLGDSYLNFLELHPGSKVLGVTATPDRSDKQELGTFYEDVAYEVSLVEMIRQGYLCKIRVRQVPLQIDVSGARKAMGDFNQDDIDAILSPYLPQIAQAIPKDRKTIVFLPLVKTSRSFTAQCILAGHDAEHIDGDSNDRRDILQRFHAKPTGVLCNSSLLTEGYDEPGIDCVVCLRPTTSRGLYSQIIGRGTRIASGKDHLLVLDFLWLTGKHPLVRPSSLVSGSREVSEIADKLVEEQGELDIEKAVIDATAMREQSLRRELERQALAIKFTKRAKTVIDPIEWALDLGDTMLADYQPTMEWHKRPASEGQLAMLKKFKVDTEKVKCMGHASLMIGRIMDRSKLKLASPGQLVWLKRRGHPSPATCSFKDARVFLESVFGKGN
jgi:superfamily II DNA or RNA helicase